MKPPISIPGSLNTVPLEFPDTRVPSSNVFGPAGSHFPLTQLGVELGSYVTTGSTFHATLGSTLHATLGSTFHTSIGTETLYSGSVSPETHSLRHIESHTHRTTSNLLSDLLLVQKKDFKPGSDLSPDLNRDSLLLEQLVILERAFFTEAKPGTNKVRLQCVAKLGDFIKQSAMTSPTVCEIAVKKLFQISQMNELGRKISDLCISKLIQLMPWFFTESTSVNSNLLHRLYKFSVAQLKLDTTSNSRDIQKKAIRSLCSVMASKSLKQVSDPLVILETFLDSPTNVSHSQTSYLFRKLFSAFPSYDKSRQLQVIEFFEKRVFTKNIDSNLRDEVLNFYESQMCVVRDESLLVGLCESYKSILNECLNDEEVGQRLEKLCTLVKQENYHFVFHRLVLNLLKSYIETGDLTLQKKCYQLFDHFIYFGDIKIAVKAIAKMKEVIEGGQLDDETLLVTVKHFLYPLFWRGVKLEVKYNIYQTVMKILKNPNINLHLKDELINGLIELTNYTDSRIANLAKAAIQELSVLDEPRVFIPEVLETAFIE